MPQRSRWSVDIPYMSLPTLLFGDPSQSPPNTPAFIDPDRPDTHRLSISEFASWSRRLAAGLRKAGLRPQDRVLVYSGNNIFFPVVFLGVVMAGGIMTTANPAFVAREVTYQIKDCEPKFLLVAEASLEIAMQAAQAAKLSPENIFIFDDAPVERHGRGKATVRHWNYLIDTQEAARRFIWDPCNTPDACRQTVAILYSSGTTGVPKGVELTHYSLVANACQLDYLMNFDPRFSRHRADHQLLCVLPMYHGLGLLYYVTVAPFRRQPVYIMKRFDLAKMLECIQRHRITELTLVPPIVVAMAKHEDARRGRYDLSSVRKVISGAAPLSREICAELEALWPKGHMNVKQGWGMTELPTSVLNWDDRQTSTSAAVGEPVPNCEAKIMDEGGREEVGAGERGELWCRGPNAMKGYWRNPRATKECITDDGWVKTGDIAFVDNDGKYHIVDRKKELIKVKSNQVAPAELEGLLLEHPEVQDAAVIGIKVGADEQPLAYVVRKPSRDLNAQDVRTFMDARTARIKHLTGGVIFTDSIPKNPSGKILRRKLREQANRVKPLSAGPGDADDKTLVAKL